MPPVPDSHIDCPDTEGIFYILSVFNLNFLFLAFHQTSDYALSLSDIDCPGLFSVIIDSHNFKALNVPLELRISIVPHIKIPEPAADAVSQSSQRNPLLYRGYDQL